VPSQITTSGKAKLIGTSKHGNRSLRKLFIHGARADGLKERAHVNAAAGAMANKMARIAWAGLTKASDITPRRLWAHRNL
tara:strand:- start:934 stop:1173 length:240 start_codon:yes stop_codon:yes gene_type:complete